MRKSTAFMKKLTALLVLALALTVTLPPATPPNLEAPGTEEGRNTEDNENSKENNNPKNGSNISPCSDGNEPPSPTLN